MEWVPPAEFDDYLLVRQLGSGSSGLVWLAEDAVLCRKVAIKFAAAERIAPAARQRFLVEARAAARIQHPNVVLLHRVGELQDRPYLISEFVRGRTLDKLEKPLPWRDALSLGIDLSRGLAAAHRQGVLHCDLKPANVILGDDGVAKLFDFELAILLSQDAGGDGARLRPEGLSGTPGYMAPEIWRGEPATRRSDVYALAAVLYELCGGAAPFHEVPLERLPWEVQEREPQRLVLEAGPAARLAAIIERGLRRDPAERFASAAELREALETVSRTLSLPAAPGGNPYRGLRTFEADHRALFFGRGMEVGVVLDRLRADAFVLVAGDSGVGKSSLCRAGLLPAVAEGALGGGRRWSLISCIPGRRPLFALCEALAPLLGVPAEGLARELTEEPRSLVRVLRRKLGDEAGLLLFVDQLEELLTIGDPGEVRVVDAALSALAEGVPGLRLIATLRADFLSRFAGLERLSEDLSRVLYFLRPLSADRIREAIVGPAQATGARFESDAMVDALVDSTARAQGGLPLLQFALAELWESRDAETGVITERLLALVGGVAGALERHADAVLAGLLPPQRAAARRMLLRLVTLEGTRARRTDSELAARDGAAKAALDALVRGRLLVAQDAEQGSAYELAHEVLVNGWGTLKRWLSDEAAGRAVRVALAQQAGEWERLGRAPDGLIGRRQLLEVDALAAEDLTALELDLLFASRRSLRKRRWTRGLLAVSVPLLAAAFWGGARLSAHSETAARVSAGLERASAAIATGRSSSAQARELSQAAFAHFDRLERLAGEEQWARALSVSASASRSYGAASRALEGALAQDPSRADTQGRLADALYEQALLAEAANLTERRDELVQRFSVYDGDGSRLRRWRAPAQLSVAARLSPAEATLTRLSPAAPPEVLGTTPIAARELEPGSYLLTLRAPGRALLRFPFLAARGERLAFEFTLPPAAEVHEPFIYVAPGRFLFGSGADEDSRRGFFNTVPVHERESSGYLISRTELTYGEWLAFLQTLQEPERGLRAPSAAAKSGIASLSLRELPGDSWQLTLPSGPRELKARLGEALVYPGRSTEARVDWQRLPVTGISALDAEAYVAWLRATGRVPRARLCTEAEWEQAARGADGRVFPHGSELRAEDANFDETHAKEGIGPDEVGSHPESRSPLGVDDMSGNAFELTTSVLEPGQYVGRGGSYWNDRKTAQLVNRELSTATLRDVTLGARICADLPH